MNNKYNILLVHNFYKQKGGEDTVFNNEKQMLIDNGHNVVEYTRNNNEIKNFNIFKKIMLPFTTIFSFKTYRNMKKIIRKENIDIVHIHNTLNLISPSIYYVSKKMNVPVVQTVHNFRLLCPNGLFYRRGSICEDCPNKGLKCAIKYNCYRDSKLQSIINVLMLRIHRFTGIYKYVNFIFLTEFNKNKFIEYNRKLNIFDENKFYVKPNFIDDSIKVPNVKKLDNQFIFVGRLDEPKGIKDIIQVWDKVNDKKLVVCGTGPLEEELKKYVKDNNLNVDFKGFLEKKEIFKNIAKSQALIMNSKLYEGFPMTILEALSVNTPIITKNIGNCGSIINNKNGYKFNNSKELINIINNFDLKNIKYNKFYDKKNNYELLIDIYRDVKKVN